MSSDVTTSGGGYEFNTAQNEIIGDTGSKMRLVGMVVLIFGFLNLLNAVLFQVMYVQQNSEQVPAEVREQLAKINTRDRWIITGYLAVVGVTLVFLGAWTRSAGASFKEIVVTKGRDISHLMEGFKALNKMYSLIATVIVAAILAYLVLIVYRATLST